MDDKNRRPFVVYTFCDKKHLAKRNPWQEFKKLFPARPKSLFFDILRWVVLAFVVYTLLGAVFVELPEGQKLHVWHRIFAIWLVPVGGRPLDIVKIVITLVGGIGAIAYLVIRFRERTDQEAELEIKAAERNEVEKAGIEARFNKAIEQLGDSSPQVRIAGVYALTDVADTYLGHYQQRTVDILCGYLRTKRVDENGDFNDAAVESTVLNVLREHLLSDQNPKIKEKVQVKNDEQLWTVCTIDLHGAVLDEDVDFAYCTFGLCNLRGIVFKRGVNFSKVQFMNRSDFMYAEFRGYGDFHGAEFRVEAYFSKTSFGKEACFSDVEFLNESSFFFDVTFCETANFLNVKFHENTTFRNAKFGKGVYFDNATFDGYASFKNVTFVGICLIDRIKGGGTLAFSGSTFMGKNGLMPGLREFLISRGVKFF